jgi:acyl carrier protein
LKVDADSIDARSCLADDFGLDLFDITELMITLEQTFCAEGEITDDPNQMECVEDLIRHIEQHRGVFTRR